MTSAQAEDGYVLDGGIEWEKDDENKVLTVKPATTPQGGYTSGQMRNYSHTGPWGQIMETGWRLDLKSGITSIGNFAFFNCTGFNCSLTIPESVTSIGNFAFKDCSNLTGSLTIHDAMISIGDYAFADCSGFTGSLTIGKSVTSIGDSAFDDCSNLTGSLTIPDSVITISDSAFFNCSGFNGSLSIGKSVTSIGASAFYGCSGFTGSLTIGNSVTSIGASAFYGCSGFTGSLTIGKSVTSIGDYAFHGCSNLTGSLTIPDSVTSIGNQAFFNCSGLNGSLTIGNSVTSIGNHAFCNCLDLNGSLTIGKSVTSIGTYAFKGCCSITDIKFLGLKPTLASDAFELDTSPSTHDVYSNGWANASTFPICRSTSWNYILSFTPDGGIEWTKDQATKTLTIRPATTPETGYTSGQMKDYDSTGIWGEITENGWELIIHDGVTHIGNNSFSNCSGFTDVRFLCNIPPTVGEGAFNLNLSEPMKIYDVYSNGWANTTTFPEYDFTKWNHILLFTIDGGIEWTKDQATKTLTVRAASSSENNYAPGQMKDYASIGPWGAITETGWKLDIQDGVTSIGSNAFANCTGFTTITIPSSIVEVDSDAFQGITFYDENGNPVGPGDLKGHTYRGASGSMVNDKGVIIKFEVNNGKYGSTSPQYISVAKGSVITIDGNLLIINGVVVTATANQSFVFQKWSIENGAVAETDMIITASFVEDESSVDHTTLLIAIILVTVIAVILLALAFVGTDSKKTS